MYDAAPPHKQLSVAAYAQVFHVPYNQLLDRINGRDNKLTHASTNLRLDNS
jgi:hypothetical protein